MPRFKVGDIVRVVVRDQCENMNIGDICRVMDKNKVPHIERISDGVVTAISEIKLKPVSRTCIRPNRNCNAYQMHINATLGKFTIGTDYEGLIVIGYDKFSTGEVRIDKSDLADLRELINIVIPESSDDASPDSEWDGNPSKQNNDGMYNFKVGDTVRVSESSCHDILNIGDICKVISDNPIKPLTVKRISDSRIVYTDKLNLELVDFPDSTKLKIFTGNPSKWNYGMYATKDGDAVIIVNRSGGWAHIGKQGCTFYYGKSGGVVHDYFYISCNPIALFDWQTVKEKLDYSEYRKYF